MQCVKSRSLRSGRLRISTPSFHEIRPHILKVRLNPKTEGKEYYVKWKSKNSTSIALNPGGYSWLSAKSLHWTLRKQFEDQNLGKAKREARIVQHRDRFCTPAVQLKDSFASKPSLQAAAHKQECNQMFIGGIKSILLSTLSQSGTCLDVLVLDGAQLNTTSLLHSAFNDAFRANGHKTGIKEFIHVPNASDSYPKMKKSCQANIYYCYLSEFLRKTTTIFAGVWADYMCTFAGNKLVVPLDDITLLFQRRLLAADSVFAITLCSRDPAATDKPKPNKQDTQSFNNTLLSSLMRIPQIASAHQYSAVAMGERRYKSMVFVWFRVKKIVPSP